MATRRLTDEEWARLLAATAPKPSERFDYPALSLGLAAFEREREAERDEIEANDFMAWARNH